MEFHKENLDLVLVPSGFLVMFLYHLFLLYKYHADSYSTMIGLENEDKKDWVQSIIAQGKGKKGDGKDIDRAVSVISSNTSASTYLATICLTLSSLIGTWLGSSSSHNVFSNRIYGDRSASTFFIKNICLLSCFLLAFSGFVQAAKYLVYANYMISSPENDKYVKKVQFAITRGNSLWHFGLRAIYFALNIILWFFGPIPMFVSSVVTVIILCYHDIHSVTLHNIYCAPDDQKVKTAAVGGRFSY